MFTDAAPTAPLTELATLIERFTPRTDGEHATAIGALRLFRFSRPTQPFHGVYKPSVCLIAQGHKLVMLGEDALRYDSSQFLLASLDLPVASYIAQSTRNLPYLALQLELDPAHIGALLAQTGLPVAASSTAPTRGMSVGCLDAPLLEAALRLVRLLARPQHIEVLAPLAVREISYLLAVGPQGAALRRIATFNDQTRGIGAAIRWLKDNYAEPFRVDEIAQRAHLSRSGFHQQFKAVTAMSPLQYQKQLRLQEARRLMLSDAADATTASLRVGYESASQFSREYRRMFGESPHRDIARLRSEVG